MRKNFFFFKVYRTYCDKEPCKNGLICEDGDCRIDKFKLCPSIHEKGDNANSYKHPLFAECKDGFTCLDNRCYVQIGDSCEGEFADACSNDTICEDGICKGRLDEYCNSWYTDLYPCQSGLTCVDYTCVHFRSLFESCEGEFKDACVQGTLCYNGICKLAPQTYCNEFPSDSCVSNLECSFNTMGLCAVDIDGVCEGRYENECVMITVCDFGRCKVPLNKSCDGLLYDKCAFGLKCIYYNCTLQVGDVCEGKYANECPYGSYCDQGICKVKGKFFKVFNSQFAESISKI